MAVVLPDLRVLRDHFAGAKSNARRFPWRPGHGAPNATTSSFEET